MSSETDALLRAFERNELTHAYQPVVELESGVVRSVEALVRWQHPDRGLLKPAAFIESLGASEMLDRLTAHGLNMALRDLPRLRSMFGSHLSVAVNIGRQQLSNAQGVVDQVERALDESRQAPWSLVIEMVEDLTNDDLPETKAAFEQLRAIGVRILLDDFGTGASSLTALTDMGYDGIKIDRSFVKNITSSSTARSVVEAVLTFGARTDITVIAEGVESALERHVLLELGCHHGQGFLFGQPQLIDELEAEPARPALQAVPSPAEHVTELADITERLHEVDVRSTATDFATTSHVFDELDHRAEALGDEAIPIRCEIGRSAALAALYARDWESTRDWATRTTGLADSHRRWADSAELLAVVAASLRGNAPDLCLDSLSRAMELRVTTSMPEERAASVDNAVGVALYNLGLWTPAREWWTTSFARRGLSPFRGSILAGVNLIETSVVALESAEPWRDSERPELSPDVTLRMLDDLAMSPHMPEGADAALRARVLLSSGDLDGARSALAGLDPDESTDLVAQVFVLRAQVRLALASEDPSLALDLVTKLRRLLHGHPLLGAQIDWTDRLYSDALVAAGRLDEAVELLRSAVNRQVHEDGDRMLVLYQWIQRVSGLDGNTPPVSLAGPGLETPQLVRDALVEPAATTANGNGNGNSNGNGNGH